MPLDPRTRAVVALACAAEFLVVLDVSIVNVALPSVRADLGLGRAAEQWVVNAYALPFAGLLLLGGRLSDVLGVRRVLVAGLALFAGASLVGGLADAPGVLFAARALQGAGAAALAPASLTLLTTAVPEGDGRTRAIAAWTAVALAGGTAGNLLGGLLTEALSWRWVLLANVPVGAVAVAVALAVLRRDATPRDAPSLDAPGAVLATLGLAATALGIAQAHPSGWDSPATLGPIAVGAALLAAFVVVEARRGDRALVPSRLVRARTVAVGNAAMLLAGACFMPMWTFLTLAMQGVLGYGPLETGLAFLPHTLLTMAVGLRLTPWLMGRVGVRTLVAGGALVAAAGFLWQGTLGPGDGYVASVLGPAVLVSLGGGLLNTPLTTAVTSGVRGEDAGAASGLANTAKQTGGVVGLATLFAVAGSPDAGAAPAALAEAYGDAFRGIAVLLVATAVVALALPGDGGRGRRRRARVGGDRADRRDRRPMSSAAGARHGR